MSDPFSAAQRRLSALISPEGLKSAAMQYLREGAETEAVAALAKCDIEYGDIYCQRGSIYEINITLRTGRDVVTKLQPANDVWKTESALKKQLAEAIKVSLPSGYDIANLDARAMAVTAKGGSGLDDATKSLLNYDMFVKPESLARIGREIVISLLSPFAKDFGKLRIKLPDLALPDDQYFPALSKVLSAKAKMPLGMIDKISDILELGVQVADEWEAERKKKLEKYFEVRLIHRATGRGLLHALAGVEGVHPDYPEKLTPLQSELVGWLLDYLRDFLDIGNDVEPGDLIKYERDVSDHLVKLENAGLRVFTGSLKSKHVFENGKSYMMPTSVVLLAAADDPRIKQDTDGTSFIKGLIEKGPVAPPNKKMADPLQVPAVLPGAESSGGKMVENLESLTSEIREFRKVMAETVRRKASASDPKNDGGKRDGATININGREEKLYHVCLWPLQLTLGDRAIDIHFKSRPFELEAQRKVLAPLFLAGNVRLSGLKEKPDPRDRGIGTELASMLKATLEFPEREPMAVFCRVRPHKHEESEMVFQEVMRESANREAAEVKKDVVITAPVTGNAFNKAGSHWDVTFAGSREFHVEDTLGAKYLDYLLHHPNEPISCFDLEVAITPEKCKARDKDSIQKGIDGKAVRKYLRELEKLRADRDEAAEDGDQAKVNRLDDEIEAISKELKKRGQSVDTGERARGNVSKAIIAVRKKLMKRGKDERAFAEHITDRVSLGYKCSYNSPKGASW